MTYSVKELFKTLQGEGIQAGRAAVFCRFSGCNLWTGLERDRTSAICQFCDTDFVGTNGPGGGKFISAAALVAALVKTWGHSTERRLVVFTGGEPLLQLDRELIDAAHAAHFEIAIESNGTIEAPSGIDWICVSPKAGAPLKQVSGNELKLVYPQNGVDLAALASLNFEHFLLQPMDGPDRPRNTELAIAYCLENPRWRISLQTHKFMGIP